MAITAEQARGELRIRGATAELWKRAASAELDRRASDVSIGTRLSDIPETGQDFSTGVFDPSEPPLSEQPPIGFIESIKEEFQRPSRGAQFVPLLGGIIGTAENLLFLDAADRLRGDFDYSQPTSPEQFVPGAAGIKPAIFTTKERDQQLIDELVIRMERQQSGYTFGGAVAKGLLNLPTWMAEFAMTGGIAKLGSEAAKQAGQKLIGRWAKTRAGETALRAAGWTGGAITRATIGLAPRVTEKATRRQVETQILGADQEGWATSFAKAWGDVVIESASETAGKAITGIPVKLLKKTKLGSRFINGLQKGWSKLTGGTAGQFAKKIAQKGGYSNIIGEYGEERLGTLLRGITDVEDFGAGPDATITERLKAGFKQDISNIGAELTILTAVPAGQVILGQAAGLIASAEEVAPITEPTTPTIQPTKQLVKAPVRPIQPAKEKIGIKVPPKAIKPIPAAEVVEIKKGKQIEVSDAEAAALLGVSLEKIKANVELKQRLSKELIITDFQPSDFVPKAKKGPGLTKAEQKIIIPEVQGKLRFAQTQGLPVGFKAGQKEANDIAKRRLDDFRTTVRVDKLAIQDARKLVVEYVKDPKVAKPIITALTKVDSPAKLAAFADKLGEFVKQVETKQKMVEYKTLFSQLEKDTRLGKVDFGKLRPAARDRILKFADTIDLQKLSVAKKEELETLMGTVKDLSVDLSEGVRHLDVDTRDALNQLDPLIDSLDRLQKTALADMGGDEIQVAIDTVKYIIRQNEIENKQIFGKRLVESSKTETKAIAEVSVSKKQKKIFKREAKKGVVVKAKRPGVFATLKRGTVGQSRTVPTLIQVSTIKGATVAKKVLDTEIWGSFREANRTQFESVDFLIEQYTKHNITIKTYRSFDKEFKVVIGGKSRVVTADDLSGIEMHLRSLDNIEQLRKTEGVWIQGQLVTDFTIQELVKAVEKLTPSQLKMLDIANVQNRTITAPAINEEFLNLWGYEPATNPNYWAIVRRFKKRVGGFFGINFSKAIEQQSSFQARTGGTRPIVIVPFRQQMWHSIQVGARAKTAIAFHNARTLLNSDKWQTKMINAGRENEMNDIIKIFERTQGLSSDKDVLELAGQKLLSNLAKSKLSIRVTTPLVQVASFPVSFSEIDNKYAIPLKGHRAQIGKAQLKRLKKFSPTIRLRFDGGRITPEVGNISAAEGFEMLVFGKVGLTNKPLLPLRAFDRATILGIDIMIQRKFKDTTNLQGDKFWEAVSLETERVVRLTQPMWDHFARSVLLTNPNFFLRATIPFRAPREAMLNVSIRGRDSLAKGDKKQFAKSIGAVSSSLVMARLIKLGIGALATAILGFFIKGRIPKRRKDISDFATDLTNDAISLAPFIGDIVAPAIEFAIEGKTFREVGFNNLLGDFAKTAGTVAFDATKAAIQFADGDTKKAGKSFQKALVGTLQVELERRGLPFTGPRDIIRPALREEKETETFGRTRRTRTRTTRTRKTRTFGRTK